MMGSVVERALNVLEQRPSMLYTALTIASAALLLLPIVVVPYLARNVAFVPHVFVNEYAKLLGSTAVSVLVAWAWKRYDFGRHRRHAMREWRLVALRLRTISDILHRLKELEAPGEDVTARGAFRDQLNREISAAQLVLEEVYISLRGLSQELREHLDERCRATSLLVDTLRLMRNGAASLDDLLPKLKENTQFLLTML